MGIVYDKELNANSRGDEVLLSTPESKVAVWVVPTNEELMIVHETMELL